MGLGTNSVKPSLRNISRAPLTVFAVSAIMGKSWYTPFRSSRILFSVSTPSNPGIMWSKKMMS